MTLLPTTLAKSRNTHAMAPPPSSSSSVATGSQKKSTLAAGKMKNGSTTPTNSQTVLPPIKVTKSKQTSSLPTKSAPVGLIPERNLGRSERIKKSLKTPAVVPAKSFSKSKTVIPDIVTLMDKFDAMLVGNMDQIPPKPPSEVRIFLSSTFSDMRQERNSLVKDVYPKIKDYCYEELNLDFRVVDMRWGVTDDAANEHMTEQLCLNEIANCQRLSLGPNFVTILGDRYGTVQIPTQLSVSDYDIIVQEAAHLDLPNKHLLEEWYNRDDNAVPPHYILQPIRSKLPHFGNMKAENEAARKQAGDKWWHINEQLLEVFRTCAESAHKRGHLTDAQRHTYLQSVTECEVDAGIVETLDPSLHALCFIRSFTSLDGDALNDKAASRHIDTTTKDGKVMRDQSTEELKRKLRSEKIKGRLSSNQIRNFELPWKPNGVDPMFDPHKHYLQTFMTEFETAVLHLIMNAKDVRSDPILESEYYTQLDEITHHGRSQTLLQVKSYLSDKKNRSPLVIYADSGHGKTSLMAIIFKSIKTWFGPGAVRLIRFLGTSPDSSTIYEVLFSIMGQLADIYDIILEPSGYSNMKSMVSYFPRFLRNISRAAKEPIFILLDSIDQLESRDDAHKMKWLPVDLPLNIHIIISTLPQAHNILETTRKLSNGGFLELPALEMDTGEEIITAYLSGNKRTLTEPQHQLIVDTVKETRSPLLLKLLLDRAVKWRSYEALEVLSDTVQGAINQLFTDLEVKYGSLLIASTLGYITVGLNGLTEVELESVLSCNDDVLNSVYHYHDPPVEGVVSIPALLWARIRYDIHDYVVERLSQGKKTIYWYHRQFIEAAKKRYADEGKAKQLHKDLCVIFMAENGVEKDITLTKRNLTIPKADRQVSKQPLVPENKRKLLALPYHLTSMCDVDQLKEHALCNLQFIMAKCKGISKEGLIKDYNNFLENGNQDEELQLVKECLEKVKLLKKTADFSFEFLARLAEDDKLPYISQLLEQCKNHIETTKKISLLPLYPCLLENKSPCLYETPESQKTTIMSQCPSRMLLFAKDQGLLQVADFLLKEIFSFAYHQSDHLISACLDHEGNVVYSLLTSSSSQISGDGNKLKLTVEERKVGDLQYCVKTHSLDLTGIVSNTDNVSVVSMVADGEALLLAMSDNQVLLWNIKNKKLMDKDVFSKYRCESQINCVRALGGTVMIGVLADSSGQDKILLFDIAAKSSHSFNIPGKVDLSMFKYKHFDDDGSGKNVGFLAIRFCNDGKHKMIVINCKTRNQHILDQVENVLAFHFGELNEKGKRKPTLFVASSQQLFGFISPTYKELFKKEFAFGDFDSLSVTDQSDVLLRCHDKLQRWSLTGEKLGEIPMPCRSLTDMQCINKTNLVLLSSAAGIAVHCLDSLFKYVLDSVQHGSDRASSKLEDCSSAKSVHFFSDDNKVLMLENTGCVSLWDLTTREKLTETFIGGRCIMKVIKNRAVVLDWQNSAVRFITESQNGLSVTDLTLPGNGRPVAVTGSKLGNVVYIVCKTVSVVTIHTVDMSDGYKITSTIDVTDRFSPNTDDIEVYLTANEDFLVFKIRITEMELSLIHKAESKDKRIFADYKFMALNLKTKSEVLIPCYRILTKIPCIGNQCVPWNGSNVIIGRDRCIVSWDIESGKCDQKMLKGTKTPMFFRPFWLESEADWGQHCHGKTNCFAKDENDRVLMVGSEDGYVMIYSLEHGKHLGGKQKSTKPPHASKVTHVAVSSDAQWGVSVCSNNTLILWSVGEGATPAFTTRLPIHTSQVIFSKDNTLLLITGSTVFGRSKILAFKVVS